MTARPQMPDITFMQWQGMLLCHQQTWPTHFICRHLTLSVDRNQISYVQLRWFRLFHWLPRHLVSPFDQLSGSNNNLETSKPQILFLGCWMSRQHAKSISQADLQLLPHPKLQNQTCDLASRLVGLVVKASTARAEDPRFSCNLCCRGFEHNL